MTADHPHTVRCWALYARAADQGTVRTRLAELRAHVEGEEEGVVIAECYDVGQPGRGLDALTAVVRAAGVDAVLTDAEARFGRSRSPLLNVAQDAGVEIHTLEAILAASGTHLPDDLKEQLQGVFAGAGPDELGERSPAWFHDGTLSAARGLMRQAQFELDESMADSPPGFGVAPGVVQARINAARAERVFAETLVELLRTT
ncbi:hypothetical protein ACIBEJ_00625 [Nonomuraea sp. NPDC050790]|uniref:hypothetical protein n=1 Tax=Nonomuraea sp. NPDC050790 TaxID=3364371 RepID=UPI003789734E